MWRKLSSLSTWLVLAIVVTATCIVGCGGSGSKTVSQSSDPESQSAVGSIIVKISEDGVISTKLQAAASAPEFSLLGLDFYKTNQDGSYPEKVTFSREFQKPKNSVKVTNIPANLTYRIKATLYTLDASTKTNIVYSTATLDVSVTPDNENVATATPGPVIKVADNAICPVSATNGDGLTAISCINMGSETQDVSLKHSVYADIDSETSSQASDVVYHTIYDKDYRYDPELSLAYNNGHFVCFHDMPNSSETEPSYLQAEDFTLGQKPRSIYGVKGNNAIDDRFMYTDTLSAMVTSNLAVVGCISGGNNVAQKPYYGIHLSPNPSATPIVQKIVSGNSCREDGDDEVAIAGNSHDQYVVGYLRKDLKVALQAKSLSVNNVQLYDTPYDEQIVEDISLSYPQDEETSVDITVAMRDKWVAIMYWIVSYDTDKERYTWSHLYVRRYTLDENNKLVPFDTKPIAIPGTKDLSRHSSSQFRVAIDRFGRAAASWNECGDNVGYRAVTLPAVADSINNPFTYSKSEGHYQLGLSCDDNGQFLVVWDQYIFDANNVINSTAVYKQTYPITYNPQTSAK